ncbi:hypothetical protein [Geodermatophilus pulveris]|uniref:hypothetical protein n=1 Tax=Geodermatophilus pulveris TaxID=1564159 RepID=UPI002481FEFD|nr:hypothetical protein [Geodermatophilus pulveris]
MFVPFTSLLRCEVLVSIVAHPAPALRDLTDAASGPHAIQLVVDRLENALVTPWSLPVRRDPGPRVVPIADDYDRLRYTPGAVTRDRRYTRHVDNEHVLRSHTSARIPALLRHLAGARPRPSRTTRPRHARAAWSRSCGGFAERRQVTPLVRFVEGVFVVGGVALHLSAAPVSTVGRECRDPSR